MKKLEQGLYGNTKLAKARKLCCNYWGIDEKVVLTKTRDGKVMNAKHSIRYMLSLDDKLTLSDVGGLTNCDHSNVINSKKVFLYLSNHDVNYAAMNRLILVDDLSNKQNLLRKTISDVILSETTPLNQVNQILDIIKAN